jgi:hypothetical protein
MHGSLKHGPIPQTKATMDGISDGYSTRVSFLLNVIRFCNLTRVNGYLVAVSHALLGMFAM